ncbi:hypothetical protein RRG08_035176 [Elysia crispata]|uniref:Integrase catalytic domain-containing protein n=1 Tax=Elysia crispata TaxID=231223 RepID=A0AAE1AXQ7_9GAST|nr:hypothetical protein RRG08_035176 [Elysia crispata]
MLRGKGTKSVVDVLKPILAKQGIPEELVADNNPFGSREMRRFAKDCDLKITTSSPHYLQSNGEAEHFVNNVKTILKKRKEDKTDPNLALLTYRNCPKRTAVFSYSVTDEQAAERLDNSDLYSSSQREGFATNA